MLRRGSGSQRLLITVLFTDIVGSTERAAALGDRGWKELVARHHAIVRRELKRFHGRELDTAGDGFFASFERPAQAIECATAVMDDLRALDLQIRAAIHMGEAEVMGGKVGGITVHVASRALAHAGPGEIVVTSTVREVTAGADVTFTDRGVHELKGVDGEWHLYAVAWQPREAPAATAGTTGPAREAARSRRTWWLAAAATGLGGVAILALTASALLPREPAATPVVAVPDSAVGIDPSTGAVRASVPAGDTPTGIATDSGTAWVLSLGDRVLSGIPMDGGTPRTIGLPGPPTGIAAGEGAVWITFGFGAAGEGTGMVLMLSSADPQQQQRIAVESGAGSIAIDHTGVWLTNGVANTLTRIDPLTRSATDTVAVGEKPVAVALGEGSVWVAHELDRTIWRLDPATLEKTAEISLRDPPTAVALGFGRLWVTSDVGGSVAVIDTTTNGLTTTIPVELGPRGIDAGAAAVWVACHQNAIVAIDPESTSITRSIDLPGPAEGVSAAGTETWVTVQQ